MPVIQKLKNLFGRNVFYVVTQEEMPRVGKMSARQLYATQANLHASLFGIAAYTVLLCYTLFRTGSLSRQIFAAH